MKLIAVILLSSALGSAADFVTGQAARVVIGQTTFTAQGAGDASQSLLGGVGGLAIANDTLFVTDANRVSAAPIRNRVLIFQNVSGFVPDAKSAIPDTGNRCPVCVGTANTVVGQPDFLSTDFHINSSSFRLPTAVASNGTNLVVADTDNNRVLLWKTIPVSNGAPADVVLGQVDFNTVRQPPVVDSKSFRGPQGVWIQNSRLFVADTQNNRVLVWNQIPTSNNQPADYVLGAPNFTTVPEPNLAVAKIDAQPNTMLTPVSVSSDGQRLFVSDLGHNRVLVWNSIPTQTQQAADLALGQPTLQTAIPNNSSQLCASNGTDSTNKPTYPDRCAATLNFPRFALSDGTRLYIADGGNDRVLIYNAIPTTSGQRADVILGQIDEFSNQTTDFTDNFRPDENITRSAADTVRTPLSLALDSRGNLYVSDPYDRRVLVYTAGDNILPLASVFNAASLLTHALGSVSFGGTIKEADTVTVTIAGKAYTYTVLKADDLAAVINGLTKLINANGGDPNVLASPNTAFNSLVLTSKLSGVNGNATTIAASTSTNAVITVLADAASLSGGQNAAEIAPGTIVTIYGANLSDATISASLNVQTLPRTLGGVQVYVDGMRAPLLFVSPTQINVQIPFEVQDASSVSIYVRTVHADGTVQITNALAVPIVFSNPGIFAAGDSDPRTAIAYHSSSNASSAVSVDGTIKANDVATVTINGQGYSYTVQAADTLASVRDALINLINADANSPVTAQAAGQYTRIVLTAKTSGSGGNGITIATSVSASAQISITALTAATCCANTAGALITPDNPAVPGETIVIYGTGLGTVLTSDGSISAFTGDPYVGPANSLNTPIDDALVGGQTANVLFAGLQPGMVGVYSITLQLSANLPTNPLTQLTIAQDVFVSNIVTIPVVAPGS